MSASFIVTAIEVVPPLIVAVVLHEVAHGWVAEKLGDPTARALGRISLNPSVHIDPIWTLAVPALLILSGSPIVFGGAKPVPVNPRYFENPRKGMMLVALAGPVSNILIALVCVILLKIVGFDANATDLNLLQTWLLTSILLNVFLAIFNMMPVPPLDGGRIVTGLLPSELADKYAKIEPAGFLIVIILLYTGLLQKIFIPLAGFVLGLFSLLL